MRVRAFGLRARGHSGPPPARLTRTAKRRLLATGPIGWRNWRAFELGTRRAPEGFQVALYSDARFIDELSDLGPYTVFNTVAHGHPTPGIMTLTLVLRVEEYGQAYIDVAPPMRDRTVGTYHGGWLADELAALLALAGGFRLEAGEMTRRFRGTRGRGVPTQWRPRPPSPAVAPADAPMLPHIARRVNLDEIRELLKSYSSVPAEAATSLVRAARQFQRGLLIAELDPNAAWLQLVSAVEVAAAQHIQDRAAPWDVLVAGWPEMAAELRRVSPTRRAALAELLAPQVRSAARYRNFLKEFPPPKPEVRASQHARVNWTKRGLSKAMVKIYDHRSAALHAGVPFPAPLCWPPRRDEAGLPEERPYTGGVGSFDAFWPPDDLPMHLHVYAYVVGHALRTWWAHLAGIQTPSTSALRPGDTPPPEPR